jgi:transposase
LLLVVESIGGYERPVVKKARAQGIPVHIANWDFARSEGLLAKTDKLDAHVFTWYARCARLQLSLMNRRSLRFNSVKPTGGPFLLRVSFLAATSAI